MYVCFATRSKQTSSFGLEVKLSKLHDKETRIAFDDSGFLGCDALLLRLFDPEAEGAVNIQNVRNHLPSDTVSYPRRTKSSAAEL